MAILEALKSVLDNQTAATVYLLYAEQQEQQAEYPNIILSLNSEDRNHHTTGASGTVVADIEIAISSPDYATAMGIAEEIREILDSNITDFRWAELESRNIDYVPAVDASHVNITLIQDTYRIIYSDPA